MKYIHQVALIAGLGLLATVGTAAAQFGDPREIPIPSLGTVEIPDPIRYEMDNGMVVMMVVDHEFPIVDAQARIRAGSIYEPAEKVGLASICGEVMRTGGSTKVDGDALDEMLESLGASVETSIGQNSGTANISTLSEDFGTGIEILADLLRRPAFPEEKIDLAKKQERTAIGARNDDPFEVMQREFPKLIYGADSPYARQTEYATIDAITRADLVEFHHRFFHPDRIILTVYGDFDPNVVKAKLNQVFGDWPPATEPPPPIPPVEFANVHGNFLIQKGDMTNSFVLMGHPGIRMDDPDYPAMQLYHEIMGGGFSSHLFNEIRTKRGLAYAAGSSAGAGMAQPGGEIFFAATQSDSTVATLGYIRDEIDKSLANPFTADEVQHAKDGILNSMVFQNASKGAVLNRLALYEYHGYPKDFLETYQNAIQSLEPDAILDAAKRNVVPVEMATMLMGNPENFALDLASLGEVNEIDITIPEPAGEEIPIATDADMERGMGIIQAMADAAGAKNLGKIHDLEISESGSFSIQGMTLQIGLETEKLLPDCEKQVQKTPMGQFTTAICGDVAWIVQMQGPQEMPAEVRMEMEKSQVRDYLGLLTNYASIRFQALPEPADVDGRQCDVVYVHSESVAGWKIYVDSTTHELVQMEYRDRSMMTGAPVNAREVFSAYEPIEGVAWPRARSVFHDGEPLAEIEVTSITANTGLTKDAFAMPAQ
ncbi:MAG: insulinase family protein [Candidatus Eisenbacteria bacterium]|uniref:Insulinase family protein n=1 Tax=Eiseniibacteriota bacterium TaxID=2212470 RepID=A0A956SBN9_UNCEI|nr:insulinase family protein [Candidatus Eisenbacteria bacterium]